VLMTAILPMASEAGLSRLKRPQLKEKEDVEIASSPSVIIANSIHISSLKNNPKNKIKAIHLKSDTVKSTQSAIAKQSEVDKISKEFDKKNALEVQSFLNSRNLGITDNTNNFDVLTGTTLKGIVLNSIVSSNLESPIIVQVTESSCDIPVGAKFICTGASRGKRVQASCLKLVALSEEFDTSANLLNIDGTSGLTGKVFTGKEEGILGALVDCRRHLMFQEIASQQLLEKWQPIPIETK
jgi:hypothetical protein